MKKILVPTDFSDNSKKALEFAADIAVISGSTLEILHTNTAAAYAAPMPEYYGAEQYDASEYYESAVKELFNLKTALAKKPGYDKLAIETRAEEGFLHSTLRRIAEEDGCDLIVMGTRGATGATEFFVGSNTEKVIRTAPCAVLAVPDAYTEFNLKTVVLPTTLTANQAPAFKALAEWQKYFPFEVKVLYLNNPAGFDSISAIETASNKFAADAGLQNTTLYTSTNTFNEEAAILQFAEDYKADLIVMGTHQRHGLSHLLFGSLTEDTANHSSIPVLSVPLK